MTQEYKKCFKCKWVKPLEDFYKHPAMADGRLNKCKECNKKDVRQNRKDNIEHYREYDRARGNRIPYEKVKERRSKYPAQNRAHQKVHLAIRQGNLKRKPCEVCGCRESVFAHHDDYLKPLDVRWLCAAHHAQWHVKNGEGLNKSAEI